MVTGNSEMAHPMPSIESILSEENYDSKVKLHSDKQTIENNMVATIMRRRSRLDRCIIRKPRIQYSMERKVRMLKKLVPNCESMGSVEGLFRETAEYIVALQMRVKLMQIVADVLSGSDHQ